MSMLAALARIWSYSVENPGIGRLLYREGNREYTFPLYEENGVLVLVPVPSSQRIYFFFNWYCHPAQDFSDAIRARILPRIEEHLRLMATHVRIFDRNGGEGEDFDFYPELFADRTRASELLEEAGYTWFSDYSAIDLLHEEYGLEVCGLRNESDARAVAEALRSGFPHWHHQNITVHEQERDPGWAVSLCLFPARPGNLEWYDGD